METAVMATQQEREALGCGFARVQSVFDDCLAYARSKLSAQGITAYIDGAHLVCKMGRGEEPVLAYLEEMPDVAAQLGEAVMPQVVEFTHRLARTPNAKAIAPFLQSLAAAARALESSTLFSEYLQLVWQTMVRTSPKVHGIDSMYSSPCLPDFLKSVPFLFSQITLGGLRNWVDYGIKAYPNDPERQCDYFLLQSADSRAVLQRERHGTLLTDHERKLDLYLRGLWTTQTNFMPYSLAFDELRKPVPYLDNIGLHLPDVYDDTPDGVRGIDRYRALLAHVTAHQRWTTWLVADNFSPFQRMAVEVFEDARVEALAMREYPGLRNLWCALHPIPQEGTCPEGWSAIRHRLYMLSRALLDPAHVYTSPVLLKYVARFHEIMAAGATRTDDMVQLGLDYIAETRVQSDQSAKMWFADTEVDYRDDNRLMWRYIEAGDEEEDATRPTRQQRAEQDEDSKLPPRLYPEWDYASQHYRPDWVSVYEHLHPKGDPAFIDQLLAKHSALAKRLKKIIDLLKPQHKVRIRYQEEGSELDLDIAIRSLIDFKSGTTPDARINMSHKHDGRSVAVSLLLDLSASLADVPHGCEQSKLELSQEAVSLLAWAVEQMGDPFAIGGFHSNTRHEVRYLHFKGYQENWGGEVKARLAAMAAGYSTRMGAAMRHAGHYLEHQQADKKLLLILTDGEPSDIDTKDERLLIEDARIAVRELDQKGIYTYCINLDPKADEYVADIFGNHYTVIDNIARLPERLPQLFMSLTK
ncbi:MAG: VWA domain-containing protein [Nitrosomonadales bacterium]|nr:MAG: VWA domain-containing protein [Nitrosomonadales bacterium]